MEKLKYKLLVLLYICSADIYSIKSSFISNKVKDIQTEILASEVGSCKQYFVKSYDRLRSEIDFLNQINPDLNNDTIFILESHDSSCLSTDLYTTIWNRRKLVSFEKIKLDNGNNKMIYENMRLSKLDNPLYIDYMIKLVTEWNLNELKKEEKIHGFVNCELKVATRIIFKDNKYKIDCICFCGFADLQRDIHGSSL